MAQRKPTVGGNWKMNLHAADAEALVKALIEGVGKDDSVEVLVCPPFPYLQQVGRQLKEAGSPIKLAAQDVYSEANGAFTGEVSVSMLKDVGASAVLTGHSERRHVIGEDDRVVQAKTRAALDAGLEVILCVGETLDQREAGQTDAINFAQVAYGLSGIPTGQLERLTIAYEPVWAIGTGKTATPDDAQQAHAAIRRALSYLHGDQVAEKTRIQYGGSCKPGNAAELFGQKDIDGGLIGGASLKPDDFLAIIEAARG